MIPSPRSDPALQEFLAAIDTAFRPPERRAWLVEEISSWLRLKSAEQLKSTKLVKSKGKVHIHTQEQAARINKELRLRRRTHAIWVRGYADIHWVGDYSNCTLPWKLTPTDGVNIQQDCAMLGAIHDQSGHTPRFIAFEPENAALQFERRLHDLWLIYAVQFEERYVTECLYAWKAMLERVECAANLDSSAKDRFNSVNETMLLAYQKDPDRITWTADKWSEELKCSAGTVKSTKTWKTIMLMRQSEKQIRTGTRR